MRAMFDNVLEAIGNTPLVRLNSVARHVPSDIYVKLEFLNPGGSVKDRPALQIIEDAEKEGLLRPGGTIVEATSGNTGMGLAMAAAVKGYHCVFVMPDKMSEEKIKALRAFGARVVITPTDVAPEDPRSYYSVARRITEETPGAFLANQYHNPSNPRAHVLSTGPEIAEQTGGELDALVIAMGTGGTISGLGRYFKEHYPHVKIVGVDPVGSVYYDYFHTGKLTTAHSYKVEGFGEDFLPSTMDFSVVDDVVRVTDKECFLWTRRVVREEGIFCGGSSGGVICAAVKWAERYDRKMRIVCILPDSAARYLSKIFDDNWMRENGYLEPEFGPARVRDLLGKRRRELVTAAPQDPVREVVRKMRRHGISQLPVVEEGDRVVGLVSESDIVVALTEGHVDADTPVHELVDYDFSLVEPDNSLGVVAQLLAQGKVVLVQDDGRLAGIITKIDLIDFMTRQSTRGRR